MTIQLSHRDLAPAPRGPLHESYVEILPPEEPRPGGAALGRTPSLREGALVRLPDGALARIQWEGPRVIAARSSPFMQRFPLFPQHLPIQRAGGSLAFEGIADVMFG